LRGLQREIGWLPPVYDLRCTSKGKTTMDNSPVSVPANILVTGSNGVVGRHFCSRYGGAPLADRNGPVDIRDSERVYATIASLMPDAVLHLAAQSSVASSFENPAVTYEVNFLGTLNVLEALSRIGFKGVFLYVGSADVYGKTEEPELPTRETQPLRPRSPYAVSKVAAEALCYQWSQTQSFRIVLTRPFNQIGPGQRARFAIADFAHQIVRISRGRQQPILTTGDLDVTRDFTDVRDTVHACRMLLESGENGEVYNICSGRERSLRSLVDGLLQVAGVKVELKLDPGRLRPAEQRRVVGDPGKIRAHIGWTPEIELETTLTDILKEVKANT
jgi:GDP-4-dehydro-6-deoxy-D-mannose reductase